MTRIAMMVQGPYETDPRVRRKAECLKDAGYAVDVIALQPPGRTAVPYEVGGVRVFGVPMAKKRATRARYIYEYGAFFLRARAILRRLAREHAYAMVDVNTLPDFLVFAAREARRKGARVVLDLHEMMPEFYRSKFGVGENHWAIRLIRWQERASFRFADHVLLIHEPMKDLFARRGLDVGKTTILVNSADRRSAAPPALQPRPPGAAFLFTYHGTLTRLYGLDVAIAAFARAQPRMPGAHFWIVGDGPERAKLEDRARSLGVDAFVRFTGTVPREEVDGWIGAGDAGVLPTRKDLYTELSFSNKLCEYVALGKPVIAARLDTTRRFFSEDALTYFEPENPDDLARAMTELYTDAALRARRSRRAAEEYVPIRWDVMRERYLALVARLCGPPT
jgi:glycosyltransferase involved in cell wall biosynthesis